ncbi:MAG TPA: DnaJ domain-containing protein [Methylomirabilota bacterium]
MDNPEIPNHYEVLQISRAAQPLIVTKAYRLLAAFYHPDNRETGDPEAFKNIVDAYRVLSDPVRRAAYDREKFGMPSPLSSNGREHVRELREARSQDEGDFRRQLLHALYNVRRAQPHRPSLPLMVIPDLFGCSIDEAQFTLWYLRGKKFIEMTDEGMAITVTGVDHVESSEFSAPSAPVPVDRSLRPGSFQLGTGSEPEP